MKKKFPIQTPISRKHNNELYKLYKINQLNSDVIHNLAQPIQIPFYVKTILSLGLNFSVAVPPHFKSIKNAFMEGLRKIGWIVHFKILNQESNFNEFDKLLHNFKKCNRNSLTNFHSTEEGILFNGNTVHTFMRKVRSKVKFKSELSICLINSLKNFLNEHNLIVKPADKNAGVCIMHIKDYENEIFRQLDDETFYFPSTESQFNSKMSDLMDYIKHYCNVELMSYVKHNSSKVNTIANYLIKLIPVKFHAAKFYILPKIHKEFDIFPKGRPISSTCQTTTKGLSQLLDKFLQPLLRFIPDLIIDTSHFLLLLNNLKLNSKGRYGLLTVDIESLYTNLNVKNSKKFCCELFDMYGQSINYPTKISKVTLRKLMDWCLDYHYIRFGQHYFYQHKGIAMGGAASVSIANLTVFMELKTFFKGPEVEFKVRFIDDLFLIVNLDLIDNVNEWIVRETNHEYLKFTHTYNAKSINFLDVLITLSSENKIITSLYKKPMSKHEYLHYDSNHPICNLKSIPYSQGIRILRVCSEAETQMLEINRMMSKFIKRNYPSKLLCECFNRLKDLNRHTLLKPKTQLLINSLRINNPEILQLYNTEYDLTFTRNCTSKVFIVMPFYKNIFNFSQIIRNTINSDVVMCNSEEIRKLALDLIYIVSYCKINNIQSLIQS